MFTAPRGCISLPLYATLWHEEAINSSENTPLPTHCKLLEWFCVICPSCGALGLLAGSCWAQWENWTVLNPRRLLEITVIASGQVEQPIRNFCRGSCRHPSFSPLVLAAGWCERTAERQCSRCYVYFYGDCRALFWTKRYIVFSTKRKPQTQVNLP